MALLLSTPHALFTSFFPTSKPQHFLHLPSAKYNPNTADAALVWLKHDIRLDDHPAFISASSRYASVLPLYIFDHRILSRFSDTSLELVLLALQDLKSSLQDHGSDLVIRFGSAESILQEFIKQLGAVDVFVEEEVEYELHKMINSVQDSLHNVGSLSRIMLWQTPFYDIKNLKDLPAYYSDFEKLKLSITSPLGVPWGLPHLGIDIDRGSLPTFEEVKRYVDACPQKSKGSWTSIKRTSASSVLIKERSHQVETQSDVVENSKKLNPGEGNRNEFNAKSTKRKRIENSVFMLRKDNVVGGGTNVVLNALAAYLRYLEGTSRYDWQEVHEKLRKAESRSGASFGTLFLSALSFGIISRRRVHYEAVKYERERNAGFLSPFGYSAETVAAAVDTVCSMEWYWLMAKRSQRYNIRRHSVRIWRWNGHLIQYTVAGHEGPATLLVHGFGAFFEHYRDNINSIADGGNRVWAITLLGFGKSEKPNIVYTELMWAELLRDFIVDVVGEPAHLVGNSIGGYFVAIVAGLWPALAKSIILINTAGSVVTGNSSVEVTGERQVSGAAWWGSRLLLFFLRLQVGSIVKNCYPTNTARADDWLINEMLRASHDPGGLVVLESVFTFNLSIPLNYLFESFGGKVLVIQGIKDPLSKSETRLAMLREHCCGIVIKEVDAGHCPHDERPEKVNSLICEWILTMERNLQLC